MLMVAAATVAAAEVVPPAAVVGATLMATELADRVLEVTSLARTEVAVVPLADVVVRRLRTLLKELPTVVRCESSRTSTANGE